ncbi:asparagine synthase (glutamine-hydrolyzing) [Gammaproteobacteria bacterium]|nr:asparagine synthase (glutamine-hydrolyzing) [Gammaproteobacteria bacterium]
MCGLACIFSYHSDAPPVNREELRLIREQMYFRGPNSYGSWISNDERIGLAHRRLSILDTSSAGNQPMIDDDNGNRIIYNGEIYNFIEIKSELETKGYKFKSRSDTEVLLKLYDLYGDDMVHSLRGMFAFVIWDEKRKGIFAARDHFGIKPLYFSNDGKTIRFASQVKALLAGKGIRPDAEPAGHVGFLLWGFVPEPFTMYKNIRSLPAGTSIWIDSHGKKSIKEYFNLVEEYSNGLSLGKSLDPVTSRERLHSALLDSVQHHLISDVPVGVFLSAGLDSSAIANLAVETGEKNINTLTLGFEEFIGTENDEVILAEMTSKHLGTEQKTFRVSRQDFSDHYDDLIQSMDQPSIDGVNTFFICKAAKDAGLTVTLSGLGGDELFGGYSYFKKIPSLMKFSRLSLGSDLIGKSFRKITSPFFSKIGSPKMAGLFEYGSNYSGAYLLCRSHYMPWEICDLLGDAFFDEGWSELQTMQAIKNTHGSLSLDRTAISAMELQWYMRGQLLRDSDWASMAHSIEIRVPFIDINLFRELTLLIGSGFVPNKIDMANSSNINLPESLLTRPKTGFSIPVHKWLMGKNQDDESQGKQDLKNWSKIIYKSFN